MRIYNVSKISKVQFVNFPQAFTRKLEYDEDTQLMSDVSENSSQILEEKRDVAKHSRNTDKFEESKALIDWCKTNRLPFFLK